MFKNSILKTISVLVIFAFAYSFLPVRVEAAAPTISAISPDTKSVDTSVDFTITVTGSNFVSNSLVYFNGATTAGGVITTYVSSGTLTALIPASLIVNPGYYAVQVLNPDPLVSNAIMLKVHSNMLCVNTDGTLWQDNGDTLACGGSGPSVPVAFDSITVTQVGGTASQGATSVPILRVAITVTGNTGSLNVNDSDSLLFDTIGSTNPNADLNNTKMYYTDTDPTFNTSDLVQQSFITSGTLQFSPVGTDIQLTGSSSPTTTHYFWLTYDVKPGATVTHLLDAAFTFVTFDDDNTEYSNGGDFDGDPAGNTVIVP